MAALGGTWLIAILGFAGLSLKDDRIAFNPKLPANWKSLRFAINWHGGRLRIGIDGAKQLLTATLESGEAMPLIVNSRYQEVRRDQATVFALA